jgi:hypothetical protein|tara:strand:- start:246 stop:494 length:249 start_codon:yes stop_codon:yes gene_type:complete
MQSRNLDTPMGKLLTAKVKELNDKFQTDFEIIVSDAEPFYEDWLYCLMVGKRQFCDDFDGQEMFAYLNGLYDGARIGRNHGR